MIPVTNNQILKPNTRDTEKKGASNWGGFMENSVFCWKPQGALVQLHPKDRGKRYRSISYQDY